MLICAYDMFYVQHSTFHSHCSGITDEDITCSARAGQDVNVFLLIVRLQDFTKAISGYLNNYLFEIFIGGNIHIYKQLCLLFYVIFLQNNAK